MHSLKYPFEYLGQLHRIPQPATLLIAIQHNQGLCATAVSSPSTADSFFCFKPIRKLQQVLSELEISEDGPEQVKRSLETDSTRDLEELFSHSKNSITVRRSLRYLVNNCSGETRVEEEAYQKICTLIRMHASGRI